MRILVANDDGIHAPGLYALVCRLKKDHDVTVIAPEFEQSAVGHAITISSPLRVKEVEKDGTFFGYAVSGTPADCVKIGLKAILDFTPDLVVSGINQGGNYAKNIIYSGTVSAATEGTIFGIRSIAVSLNSFADKRFFPAAADFTAKLIEKIPLIELPPDTFLNVNHPDTDKIAGVKIVKQGNSRFVEEYEKRIDPRGNSYYWMRGEMETGENDLDTDYHYIKENYVTITPIMYDLTHYEAMKKLGALKTLNVHDTE